MFCCWVCLWNVDWYVYSKDMQEDTESQRPCVDPVRKWLAQRFSGILDRYSYLPELAAISRMPHCPLWTIRHLARHFLICLRMHKFYDEFSTDRICAERSCVYFGVPQWSIHTDAVAKADMVPSARTHDFVSNPFMISVLEIDTDHESRMVHY